MEKRLCFGRAFFMQEVRTDVVNLAGMKPEEKKPSDNSYNLKIIHDALEGLGVDFIFKPVGDSQRFVWLCGPEDTYAIKLKANFLYELQTVIIEG